jgi:hypothetical protein
MRRDNPQYGSLFIKRYTSEISFDVDAEPIGKDGPKLERLDRTTVRVFDPTDGVRAGNVTAIYCLSG